MALHIENGFSGLGTTLSDEDLARLALMEKFPGIDGGAVRAENQRREIERQAAITRAAFEAGHITVFGLIIPKTYLYAGVGALALGVALKMTVFKKR